MEDRIGLLNAGQDRKGREHNRYGPAQSDPRDQRLFAK
jgi:hypothetical protein